MAHTFTNTNSTSHSQNITGLTDGNSYIYYIRCQDSSGNQNTDDFTISFSVAFQYLQCSNENYNKCANEESCLNAGGYWCTSVCQEDNCGYASQLFPINISRDDIKFGFGKNKHKFNLKKNSTNYIKKNSIYFKGRMKELSNGKVILYIGNKRKKEVDINKKGEWKIKYKAKKGSKKEYKLKFYNKNNNFIDSKKYRIRIDTTKPIIEIPPFLVKKPGNIIWWYSSDNYKIKKTSIYLDNKKYNFVIHNYSKHEKIRREVIIPYHIKKGLHKIKIKTYDKAGNKSIKYILVKVQ